MLESHNDSAVAIAEHVGGCVEAFADMMNEKARQIGCENTCFVTPQWIGCYGRIYNGGWQQGDKEHTTTATDLARILSYCITGRLRENSFWRLPERPPMLLGISIIRETSDVTIIMPF